ncbi:uncharacterized protein LOC128198807 [Bicyclus anynana]|uniref:Uncharacterized protein LOC128198807 n=1 Tax=Bicyclus anynana TaxID=110368 RepID=A0ABM3LS32_BICAN|nr:uncharacterized protein LOC128198807 [Bicyclus anynana]
MPRIYIRKTNRQNWPEEQMQKALDAVRDGMPYKTASREFKVPVMALKRRAKGKNKIAVGSVKKLGGKKTVFNLEQEQELVDYIKDMESRMYGLTTQDVLTLAFQLAERNNLPHPFSEAKGKAGLEWLRGFRRRHPDITMRAPESTSSARARAFNKPVVDIFFSTLKNVLEKHYFPPHRIFNVDETSLCTVPTKNSRVFAQTGRKQVARVTSAERGETTTAVICTSASGTFVPPMLIFRRVRMKIELMDGAPPGAIFACNPSGWMKLDVFSQWFDHFLIHAKPTAEDPALLILDGHLSHTKNLNVVLKARDNHVTILCLPPHCTHKLQPLDVGVMYPLSVYHNQALEKWMNNNPGRVVTVFQITKIFTEAYLKAAVPLNSMNGFSKTGIYPFNPDIFTNVDFIAAETTEMDVDNDTVEPPILVPGTSSPPLAETMQAPSPQASNPETETLQSLQVDIQEPLHITPQLSPIETSTPIIIEKSPRTPLSLRQPSSFPENTSASASSERLPLTLAVGLPSTSFGVVTPREVRPIPKIVGKRATARRIRVDTSVLTSTPYKKYLEEEVKKKTAIEQKKNKKTVTNKQNDKFKCGGKGKGVGKGKRSGKGKGKKKQNRSDSSEEESDTECLFCTESYSKDNKGEGWIRCVMCLKWGHEACAGIDSDDEGDFTCDICLSSNQFHNVKKNLRL